MKEKVKLEGTFMSCIMLDGETTNHMYYESFTLLGRNAALVVLYPSTVSYFLLRDFYYILIFSLPLFDEI